jgi:glycosyltransferase involved in cell wall biosynthesis
VTTGFHSPLPPAATGVAGYAATLLEALRERGEVVPGARDAAVHLYHLGNNHLHREIYRRALEQPGVVVLHDAVLHHFLLGSLDRDAYIEEFVYNYGEWHRALAAELWTARPRSGADPRHFRYPMLRRIAEASRALIVHNPAAVKMVLAHAPAARVYEVPHLWTAPAPFSEAERLRLRQQMGIPPGSHVFAVLGHLRESKRLPAVLRAFDWVHRQGVEATLLIAGRFVSPHLERSIAPSLNRANVVRIGDTPDAEFWRLAAVADTCINLRHPSAGETSGITVRLMGLAKPVILTESEEVSRFPEDSCLRVAPGVAEQAELGHYMILLARSPELAGEIGRRAAAYVHEHHAVEKVAGAYWDILCACQD